jgi:S-adenosylmethionine synthetase
LRPDGKSRVTVEYSYGKPKRIGTILVSTQHTPEMLQADIREQVIEHIILPSMPDGIEPVNQHLDLPPGAIIRDLGLHQPIYRKTAAYGHFGRDDIEFPWERIDKAELLKKEARLQVAA